MTLEEIEVVVDGVWDEETNYELALHVPWMLKMLKEAKGLMQSGEVRTQSFTKCDGWLAKLKKGPQV
jgi:hypothetical protein